MKTNTRNVLLDMVREAINLQVGKLLGEVTAKPQAALSVRSVAQRKAWRTRRRNARRKLKLSVFQGNKHRAA